MTELADALAEGLLTGTLVPPAVVASLPPRERMAVFAARVVVEPANPQPAPAPPPKVSAAPPLRTPTRTSIEESARASAKRLRYVDEWKFALAKAGYTAHKQSNALLGTPLAAEIANERWTFTRRRACPFPGLRLVAFSSDGDTAFAVSAFERDDQVLELRGGTWFPFRLEGVRPADIECACVLGDDRIAIGGRTALAAVAHWNGSVDHWSVRGQVGHVIADVRSTGDGAAFRTVFNAVDARISDEGDLELAFVGSGNGAGIAAVGSNGRLTQHVSNGFGPIADVVSGKVIVIAGRDIGVVTDEGIESAGNSDVARKLVAIDDESVLALNQRGFLYVNVIGTSTWPELCADRKVPVVAAAVTRKEVYAVDEKGTILRRSASLTWVPVPEGVGRAVDPIAMWAGPGHVRIVCADGAIVEGRRSG